MAGKRQTTINRFTDLCAFWVGYTDFFDWVLELDDEGQLKIKAFSPAEQKAIHKHVGTAQKILKLVGNQLDEGMELYVGPLLEQRGITINKGRYTRAMKPGPPKDTALTKASFLEYLFGKLGAKQQILNEMFGGKALKPARAIANLVKDESPTSRINKLAALAPVSGWTLGKKWLAKAAEICGVPISDVESAVIDAQSAQDLGSALKELQGRLDTLDPTDAEAVALEQTKQELISRIDKLDGDSQLPDGTVKGQAAAAAVAGPRNYRTKIGAERTLSPDQEDAMLVRGRSVIAAGAGSGKTRVLAAKVVYHMRELGLRPGQIVATSFSKKSAEELKSRIRKFGGDIDKGDDGMGTTHSISLGLLREYAPAIGKKKILDSATPIIKMAREQVQMRGQARSGAPEPEGMFDGLYGSAGIYEQADEAPIEGNDKQVQFINTLKAILDMVDWAERQYGASNWMRSRRKLLEPMISGNISLDELDAGTKRKIQEWMDKGATAKKLQRDPEKYLTKLGAQKTAAYGPKTQINYYKDPANQWWNMGMEVVDSNGRAIGAKRFGTAISKYRADLITPSQAWAQDKNVFAAVYCAYEWIRKNDAAYANTIDFDDMLAECCKMLVANPKTLKTLQQKFKCILVDEAQDLNKAQHLLFGMLAGYIDPKTQEPYGDGRMTADTYCFIGDDKQAIYEFRGADPERFIEKSDLVEGGEGFETKILKTNYRSGEAIVDAANRLIAHNTKQIPMVCEANPPRGQGVISNVIVGDHMEGANLTANEIEDTMKVGGHTYDDFGVAVRTNAEALAFGVELIKRGIPFRSKMNFFTDHTTKALVAWLQLAEAEMSDTKVINAAVLACHRTPKFGLDRTFNSGLERLAKGQNYLQYLISSKGDLRYEEGPYTGRAAWKNKKNVLPYVEVLESVFALSGTPQEVLQDILQIKGISFQRGKAGKSIIEALIDNVKGSPDAMDLLSEETESGDISEEAIRGLALAPIQPLLSLLGEKDSMKESMEYIRKLQKANEKKSKKDDPGAADYDEPAVVIDTCHGWKGLETKHLYVPMPEGVFPHVNSSSEEELASERRLAYVALTRGADSVTVLNPMESHIGRPAGVSRFVEEACIKPAGSNDETSEALEHAKTASLSSDLGYGPGFLESIHNGAGDEPEGLANGYALEAQWGEA